MRGSTAGSSAKSKSTGSSSSGPMPASRCSTRTRREARRAHRPAPQARSPVPLRLLDPQARASPRTMQRTRRSPVPRAASRRWRTPLSRLRILSPCSRTLRQRSRPPATPRRPDSPAPPMPIPRRRRSPETPVEPRARDSMQAARARPAPRRSCRRSRRSRRPSKRRSSCICTASRRLHASAAKPLHSTTVCRRPWPRRWTSGCTSTGARRWPMSRDSPPPCARPSRAPSRSRASSSSAEHSSSACCSRLRRARQPPRRAAPPVLAPARPWAVLLLRLFLRAAQVPPGTLWAAASRTSFRSRRLRVLRASSSLRLPDTRFRRSISCRCSCSSAA
eukprot:comp21188_c0_seq1/m.45046 comp21188_c0_seq1/g.45046  ORF comp21188_c0_seq1/g.45046 comp21188_c0_seq1/m.45046 type:complete len:334 (+) comp21188_c0_seq1:122-1123(+)